MATTQKTVKTVLNHYDPINGPRAMNLNSAEAQSYQWKSLPVEVTDIRSCDEDFTLDKHGFQLVKHKVDLAAFESDTSIKEKLYPQVEAMLKKVTGATHAAARMHMVRESTLIDLKARAQRADSPLEVLPPGPATNVHVGKLNSRYPGHKPPLIFTDQSYDGALTFKAEYGGPYEHLFKTRWSIINVWCPLAPVTRDNLVLGDWCTLDPSQLYPVPLHFAPPGSKYNAHVPPENVPTITSVETWRIAPREDGGKNDWYYASNMTPDEVFLIKCFDTKVDGRARLSPHGAFQCEDDHGPARRSCELRCLVFWEDQGAE